MTAHYVADTDRLGLGRPDHEPRAAETIGPIVDADRGPDRGRARLRGGRRRVLQRVELRRLRPAVEPPARRDRAGRGRRRRRSSRRLPRLRAVEGAQGGRGHRVARALGRGPAGLAHRVLRDGGGDTRHRLRDPRRRLRPRVPPPRERDRPDRGGARRAARPHLDAQRHGAHGRRRRWPSRWATSSAARGARRLRPRRPGHLPRRRALPPADRLLCGGAGGGRARGGRLRELCRRLDPDGPAPEGLDAYTERFFGALADDFNTPAARAVLFEWVGEANRRLEAGAVVGRARSARCSMRSGSRACSRA